MSTAGDGEFPVAQRQARREADLRTHATSTQGPTSDVRRPLLTSLGRTTVQAIGTRRGDSSFDPLERVLESGRALKGRQKQTADGRHQTLGDFASEPTWWRGHQPSLRHPLATELDGRTLLAI